MVSADDFEEEVSLVIVVLQPSSSITSSGGFAWRRESTLKLCGRVHCREVRDEFAHLDTEYRIAGAKAAAEQPASRVAPRDPSVDRFSLPSEQLCQPRLCLSRSRHIGPFVRLNRRKQPGKLTDGIPRPTVQISPRQI